VAAVIDWVTVSPFQSNCYLVACPVTRQALLIDAGDEAHRIQAIITFHQVTVKFIVATHGHLDHVLAVRALKEATGASFLMPEGEWALAQHAHELAPFYGWVNPDPVPMPDGFLREGDTLTVGTLTFQVLSVPGHSPDHIALFLPEPPGHLFCGDVLFAGSVGRTDLPGGDARLLQQSLRRLMTLPDETIVYPGHGPATTIGQERRSNPFVSEVTDGWVGDRSE
jgi:glyoxylase-like metal-dependent hydrolase (beta-lactamase superfamily II)